MKKKLDAGREALHAFLATSNTMSRKSEILFGKFQISPAQFNALNLAALNGGSVSQKELVKNLLVGKSSISILLNRMIRDHLITQKPDPSDLRKSIITLTSKGKKKWEEASPEYAKAIESVFSNFDKQDLRKFQSLLHQLDLLLQQKIEE